MSYKKNDLYDGPVTEQIAGHVKEIPRLLGEDETREGLLNALDTSDSYDALNAAFKVLIEQ